MNEAQCNHKNGRVWLYETKPIEYTFENGKVIDSDDDFELIGSNEGDFLCLDCNKKFTYENWKDAPEPILGYFYASFYSYENL